MTTIATDPRIENENELLALILNKNEVISLLQIKPEYLASKENQKVLRYAIESYEEFGFVSPNDIHKKHNDFNIDYYVELYTEYMWFESNWKQQLNKSQEQILKLYKEDYIKLLNEQLKTKKIDYDNFMERMKKVEEFNIFDNSVELTKDEIKSCIYEKKQRIELNKFKKLDNVLKLVQGDFLIIGATTGAGKSGLMLNIMSDVMEDYQCIYFNMEMSKSTIYKRLVAINGNMNVEYVDQEDGYWKDVAEETINKIEKCKLIIEHKANDITGIRSTIAKMKDLNKHTIIFIDHLGLVKADGSRSLYEQTTEVAKQLRQICLDYDCTIISASQLNRGAYTSDEITLSMLKDSGELENSASKVMLLYKDKEANKDDVIQRMVFDVAKNRDGYTGLINAVYNKEKQIFNELEDKKAK